MRRPPDGSGESDGQAARQQPIVLETGNGVIQTRLGLADGADAVVAGPARSIIGLLLGLIELADAKPSGVEFDGDPAILDRIAGTPGR